MGKKLIIIGADFSKNSIEKSNSSETPKVKKYLFGITDDQFAKYATSSSKPEVQSFAFTDSLLAGKEFSGIRLNVKQAGTLIIYKSTTPEVSSVNSLTQVATITATKTGIQDLTFSSPITMNFGEYMCLGKPASSSTDLKFGYDPSADSVAKTFGKTFYHHVGMAYSNPSRVELSGCLVLDLIY